MNCKPSATEKHMVNYFYIIEITWAMHAKGAQVQKKKRINNLNPYTKNQKQILLQPCRIFVGSSERLC